MAIDEDDEEALELARRKVLRELSKESALRRCCKSPSNKPREVLKVDDLIRAATECVAGVILFYSPTCPYCMMFEPVYNEAARILGDRLAFLKVNVFRLPELAAMFNVMGTPTVVAFRRGREVGRIVGLPPIERFEDMLYSLLEAEGCPIPAVVQ